MKQMKIFLVAVMAVIMGISVTSCMKGDENTQYSGSILGKVKDNMFSTFTFQDMYGVTYQTKNSVEGSTNLSSGDYIVAGCSFDTEADKDPSVADTYHVNVISVEKISGNAVYSTTKQEDQGENSMYGSNRAVITIKESYASPMMLDNYNLLIPIIYFAQEKRTSHTFSLVYYNDESEIKDKTELKLYLRHTSTEEQKQEIKQDFVYKVFNIYQALYEFKTANGKYPTKIIIEAEVNQSTNTVPDTTTPVSMDYKFNE